MYSKVMKIVVFLSYSLTTKLSKKKNENSIHKWMFANAILPQNATWSFRGLSTKTRATI